MTQHVLSLSYGKDSLACLGAIEQLGWPLDRIVHAEVWATEDFHFTDDDLEKLQQRILYYCSEIQSSRLRLSDIISALKEEHDISIELTERREK